MKITPEHYRTLSCAIHRSQQGMETLDEYVNQHELTATCRPILPGEDTPPPALSHGAASPQLFPL